MGNQNITTIKIRNLEELLEAGLIIIQPISKKYVLSPFSHPLPPLGGRERAKNSISKKKKKELSNRTNGFFGLTKKDNTFDRVCYLKLEKLIREKRKIFRKVQPHPWMTQFFKLRIIDGIDKYRLKRVLNWYVKHFNEEFVPKAYSARSFRDKFLQIEDAMNRISPEKSVKISQKAKETVDQFYNKSWPGNIKNSLPVIIELSLQEYQKFIRKHTELLVEIKSGNVECPKNLLGFIQYISEKYVSPASFIRNYLTGIFNQIKHFEQWHGGIISLVFNSDKLRGLGYEWAKMYCDDTKRWDSYWKFLNENTK